MCTSYHIRLKALAVDIITNVFGFGIINLISLLLNTKVPFIVYDALVVFNLLINVAISSPGFSIFKLEFIGSHRSLKLIIINLFKNLYAIIKVNHKKLFRLKHNRKIRFILLILYAINFVFLYLSKKTTLLEFMARLKVEQKTNENDNTQVVEDTTEAKA